MNSTYAEYGLFLGFFDHASAIRVGDIDGIDCGNVMKIRSQFKSHCESLGPKDRRPFTFEPVFATSFGYADDLAIMVVDSFEIAARIASSTANLDSFTIAHPICPNWFGARRSTKLLLEPANFVRNSLYAPDDESQPAPLLVVTQIKLSGLLTLAFGIHAQLFAASLFLDTAHELLECIRQELAENELPPPRLRVFGSTKDDAINAIDSFRMSITTPVSSEDLVIVCHTKNYSVACSVLAAFRNLTFQKLLSHVLPNGCKLQDSPQVFQQYVEDNGDCPFRFLNSFCPSPQLNNGSPQLDSRISGNHVCSASYSTLGVLADINKFDTVLPKVSGYAMIHSVADINPGHETQVEHKTSRAWHAAVKAEPKEYTSYQCPDKVRFFLPGKHDLSLQFSVSSTESPLYPPLSSFLRFLQERFGAGDSLLESGFQEIQTSLGIPIPSSLDSAEPDQLLSILQPPIDPLRHANIMLVLRGMAEKLYETFNLSQPHLFDLAMRRARLSASTRASTLRLYNEFCHAISDPLQCDNVVDLTDAFRCLYSMIFDAPKMYGPPEGRKRAIELHYRRLFGEFLEGLRQSFVLRLGRSSAKSEERYGEHRSSIAGLLCAGDTAIKSSLGLLRMRLYPELEDWLNNRDRVTGVIVPDLKQRPTVVYMVLGDRQYTQIRIDSFHVFRPHFLTRILHETCHLHYAMLEVAVERLMASEFVSNGVNEYDAIDEDCMKQGQLLASELFCDAVVYIHIFLVDAALFARHHIRAINSIQGDGTLDDIEIDDKALVIESIDSLHRLYIVSRYVTEEHGEFALNPIEEDRSTYTAAFSAFLSQLAESLPLEGSYESQTFQQTAACWAESTYAISRAAWNAIVPELRHTVNVVKSKQPGSQLARKRILVERVSNAICAGQPVPLANDINSEAEGEITFALLNVYTKQYLDLTNKKGAEDDEELNSDARIGQFKLSTNVMRSLWHISTRQRRRRLASLVKP